MTHMYHGRAALKAMKCWSTACGGIQNKQVYTKKKQNENFENTLHDDQQQHMIPAMMIDAATTITHYRC